MAQAGATLINLGRKPGRETTEKRSDYIPCSWHVGNYNDSQMITQVSTCKQSTEAVLRHNPAHHAEGGGVLT